MALAVTVGWRVTRLVTDGPMCMAVVAIAATFIAA